MVSIYSIWISGLSEGQTPGEVAGIHIDGADKLLTLILVAAKAMAGNAGA